MVQKKNLWFMKVNTGGKVWLKRETQDNFGGCDNGNLCPNCLYTILHMS